MGIMTRNPQATCSHEQCDMEPCTAYDFMTYEYDSVWCWGTTCERCEQVFMCLPEEHAEARHEEELA